MTKLSGQKIGMIGLGLMGAPMAHHLLEAGADLTVYNRSSAKMKPLIEKGAKHADNCGHLAQMVDSGIIVICVNDTEALKAVMAGSDNLLAHLSPGALVIDMGTSDVAATRDLAQEIAQCGAIMVDAPVSGGAIGAQQGTLTIMAGGTAEAIKRAQSIFEVLGSQSTHIGPQGTGQIAKCANQLIVGATLVAVAEALGLAQAAGADAAKVREALLGGFAASRILEVHGNRMIKGEFEPGGRAITQLKDLTQALDLAHQSNVALPSLEQVTQLWQAMADRGLGDLDQAGIYKLISARA